MSSEETPIIVIVDDEEMVLTSLKSFLTLETDYDIQTFTSAKKAIQFVQDNKTSLVVSDYLMPEMNGIEFLSEIKKIDPSIPRIIITGYADKENAIKAINEVGLYQYIEKPWDNDDILIIFRNALEKKMLLNKLEDKMGQITKASSELQNLQLDIVKAFI